MDINSGMILFPDCDFRRGWYCNLRGTQCTDHLDDDQHCIHSNDWEAYYDEDQAKFDDEEYLLKHEGEDLPG